MDNNYVLLQVKNYIKKLKKLKRNDWLCSQM